MKNNRVMAHLIDKNALVAEIKRRIEAHKETLKNCDPNISGIVLKGSMSAYQSLLYFLDTFEVKEDSLEKFKSLQHITSDMKSTIEDWGYAPNLYYFDGSWHVDWISCEEGDSIHGFTAETPEEAIDKACKWFHSTFCNS